MDFDQIITTEEAGTLLGVSQRRINQLIAEQYIERVKTGRVRLSAAVRGYARSLKAQPGGTNADAQRDLARARAEKIALEIALAKRELVETESVINLAQSFVGAVVSELGNWSARTTRDANLRVLIDREVAASLACIQATVRKATDEIFADGDEEGDAPDEQGDAA